MERRTPCTLKKSGDEKDELAQRAARYLNKVGHERDKSIGPKVRFMRGIPWTKC